MPFKKKKKAWNALELSQENPKLESKNWWLQIADASLTAKIPQQVT